MKSSISRFPILRGVRHHVREWGDPAAPRLFLLHGWGDTSATFQFLVDALRSDWYVIAPDWRGFGQSARAGDAYWFPDYIGDLDALLREYSPYQAANLVGHSMGGNVACVYAGVRPVRVRRVVALDAFGLPDRPSEEAPGRLQKWLEQLASKPQFRSYPDVDAFARRMMRDNPRLDEVRARFLAENMTEADGEGGFRAAVDSAHKNANPVLYRRAEVESCWRRVSAPVLWLVQADPSWRRQMGISDDVYREGTECFRHFTELGIADSGHNLHHDQPALTAAAIEDFCLADHAH